MTFHNPQTICTCSHTDKVEPANKDDEILPKQTLHDVEIAIVTTVNLTYPIVRRAKEFLTLDIKITTKIVPEKISYDEKRLDYAGNDQNKVELD